MRCRIFQYRRCTQKLGKWAPVLVLVPIFLNVGSQIITYCCGNVKTKYFNVLKRVFFFFPDMNVVKVMVWIPENLFCVGQRSDLLGLPYFFFPSSLFFFLWVILTCICVNQKKSDRWDYADKCLVQARGEWELACLMEPDCSSQPK